MKKTIRIFLSCFLFLASCFLVGCATADDIFEQLGNNISSPNGIAINLTKNRLYLVNSNSNVLYDWREGSIQVLDITNPLSPQLMDTVATDSFSGEALIDSTRNLLYITNRFSESEDNDPDNLLILNIDDASPDYLNLNTSLIDKDPYALYCCYPANRMWIVTENNRLDYRDLGALTGGYIDLQSELSNGASITQVETSYIAVIGNQAFLPRIRGGLLVVNLDEAGDPTKHPVDYYINDIRTPGGIATDGTFLYLVDEENVDGHWTPLLLVIDPSSLTPLTDNTTAEVKDKENDGLLVVQIEVDKKPKRVFLSDNFAWVTSWDKDLVSVIELGTWSKMADIQVGEEPFNMALYAPGGVEQYFYVGNVESNTLSIIDIGTLTVVATYP